MQRSLSERLNDLELTVGRLSKEIFGNSTSNLAVGGMKIRKNSKHTRARMPKESVNKILALEVGESIVFRKEELPTAKLSSYLFSLKKKSGMKFKGRNMHGSYYVERVS